MLRNEFYKIVSMYRRRLQIWALKFPGAKAESHINQNKIYGGSGMVLMTETELPKSPDKEGLVSGNK